MSRRIRQSFASTARISLLSAAGALGLLALSAGAANADDDGKQGLLGSVTSVVESVSTPVEAVVEEVSEPLDTAMKVIAPASATPDAKAPGISAVVQGAPEIIADIGVVNTVAPVTDLVDRVVAKVPIVNAVVPQGTTTAVTQPVLEVVDVAAAPVLPSVQEVVTPVVEVLVPVTETVDPVVEVVRPVVDPVVDPVVEVVEPVADPVVEVVQPVTPVAPVVPIPDLVDVVEPVELVAPVDPMPVDPKTSVDEERASVPATVGAATDASPLAQGAAGASAPSQSLTAVEAFGSHTAPSPQGAVYALQGLPDLAMSDHQQADTPLGIGAGSAASGAAATGSAGAGSSYAAVDPFSFDFNLSSVSSSQTGYAAALPSTPTLDPGSTPD
ncbi:hypothetical protein [uncultured Arthrobacter sp.]|uniref:hypothetical protein n=1 Tax=uncultured Arthrobacter sp. TaxID=114050 RepID=UPI002622267A|nr:hypothetical protein [uncultured Arthrobacter sp.]